jgi:putative DNA primase/helicase
MIAGCLEWRRNGLQPPKAVTAATDEYLHSEDALARWAEECCIPDPQAWESIGDLYESYRSWAEKGREHIGRTKRLSQNLEARGYCPQRKATGRGFVGLQLVRPGTENIFE